MANTWQGEFPWQNLQAGRLRGHVAGRRFPPNGYGLYDMAGNVWEWTTDFFTPRHPSEVAHACCVPRNPRVDGADGRIATRASPGAQIPRKVIKGGSHLCAPNYCLRYRPAARQPQTIETRRPTSASAASSARPRYRSASCPSRPSSRRPSSGRNAAPA